MICSANRLTGFYMIGRLAVKRLTIHVLLRVLRVANILKASEHLFLKDYTTGFRPGKQTENVMIVSREILPEAATGGVLYQKGFLKNFASFQENTCPRVYFLY